MVTKSDIYLLTNKLKNLTCVLGVRANKYKGKYSTLIASAEELYGADDDFEKYESYLLDRIDSEDLVNIRNFSKDISNYINDVDKLLKSLVNGGIYVLYELDDCDIDGTPSINDYDSMGYVFTEHDAIVWRNENPKYRAYKFCNMKEVSVDDRE